jgi:hypothetical protein
MRGIYYYCNPSKHLIMQKKVNNQNSYFLITSIIFDNIQELITIVTEKGTSVTQTTISLQTAIDIGFINLNSISKILNQNK